MEQETATNIIVPHNGNVGHHHGTPKFCDDDDYGHHRHSRNFSIQQQPRQRSSLNKGVLINPTTTTPSNIPLLPL